MEKSDGLYPTGTMAKLFGLTERRVQQLVKERVIPQVRRGFFDLGPTVQAYVRHLQDRVKGKVADDPGDLTARKLKAEIEEREAKARKAQISVAIAEGRLLKRDDVVRERVARVIEVKAALLEMPRRVGFLFPDPAVRHQVEEEVERSVHEMLERYSRHGIAPAALVDPGGTGGLAPAEEDLGERMGG